MHLLGLQARDEGHVAGKPVELKNDDAACLSSRRQCGSQLWPAVQSVGSFSRGSGGVCLRCFCLMYAWIRYPVRTGLQEEWHLRRLCGEAARNQRSR
ncbi:hypothetical protein GGQ85_003875 [Nitrobacter vulgaris]|jgi:hypothetical protein|nr:hypothetical protein [Nitrobacter vulgaris]